MRVTAQTLLCLWLPGVLPALLVADDIAGVVFASALFGALMVAVAALCELVLGGGLVPWYVGWVVAVDLLCALALFGRLRSRPDAGVPAVAGGGIAAWVLLGLAVAALAWPATALGAHLIGYDAHAIWILHSIFVYGGHTQYLADLKNPAYAFSNPDYPPLASAAGALGFFVAGRVDYHLAVSVTTVLDAAAVGTLATGIARVARGTRSTPAAVAAVATASAVCLVCFGIGGQYAVDGYADLLWSAAAAAAVVYGLVLPRSPRHLAMAWLGATVAALTKNEGLIAAVIVLAVVAVRYVPTRRGSPVATWATRSATALALALPGAAWALAVKAEGVGNTFFGGPETGSASHRLTTTVSGLWPYLHLVPLAAAVAVAGALVLGRVRRDAVVANPAWLWATLALWTAGLLYTYTFGRLPIAWWLRTSADRTTIFPQVLLFAEMTVWTILALDRRGDRREPAAST